ncbi:hypothetical protein UFOVP410_133 [uncultured Caudovirales phage]|uniref:Uncharacterized protein n=1 Tax=uncultured Caudovirales phage TaxID=2100421 RepID=A0A6J5M3F0_9CAUD|nr:hypothetical protein UFOVP410_133 [uncultured Caudovirales phage]
MKTPKVILLAEEYCRNRPKFSGYSIEEADAFVAGYRAAQNQFKVMFALALVLIILIGIFILLEKTL